MKSAGKKSKCKWNNDFKWMVIASGDRPCGRHVSIKFRAMGKQQQQVGCKRAADFPFHVSTNSNAQRRRLNEYDQWNKS